jgi:endonuclease-3
MSDIVEILEILMKKFPRNMETLEAADPFRTLIGCIISQRTRDTNSEKATSQLFEKAKTPSDVLALSLEELHELIRCSGFYQQKTLYLLQTCKQLTELYGGKVPPVREELLTLHGVGPKTADIVITYCFGGTDIPVDVHVSRVTRRLGLAPMNSKASEVKNHLMKIIPENLRVFYDRSILEIGKKYCRKTEPRCVACPLRTKCKYASAKVDKSLR